MTHFLKDKKCSIYEITVSVDTRGARDTSLSLKIPDLWCYTKQLNADLYFRNRAEGIKDERLFVLTKRPDVKVGDVIEYAGEYFRINRADDTDKNNVFCYVEKYQNR